VRLDEQSDLPSVNLDRNNPRRAKGLTHRSPEEPAASILVKERRIAELVADMQQMLRRSAQ
jgi:hypothetical protein